MLRTLTAVKVAAALAVTMFTGAAFANDIDNIHGFGPAQYEAVIRDAEERNDIKYLDDDNDGGAVFDHEPVYDDYSVSHYSVPHDGYYQTYSTGYSYPRAQRGFYSAPSANAYEALQEWAHETDNTIYLPDQYSD